jgi:hypothetical protein
MKAAAGIGAAFGQLRITVLEKTEGGGIEPIRLAPDPIAVLRTADHTNSRATFRFFEHRDSWR